LVSSIGMMYFFLYFMITNVNRMEALIMLYLPFSRKKIKLFGDELHAQTMSNALGVPLIAVIQGFVAFLAYWFLGLPEAGFWAVLTGICSIIPVVGAAIIWLPIAVFMFLHGPIWHGVVMLAWGFAVIGVMDNVVRFILAKKMADVHPIVTILGVIIGLNYFGITGLIFGPLLISYFVLFAKIYYQEYLQNKGN
jgi:predicted PurR-regulated permease PerM